MYQLTASWRIICGSAAGLAVLGEIGDWWGEIREVPAVQRQAALEQGTDNNWNKARNLKEVLGGGQVFSERKIKKIQREPKGKEKRGGEG